MQDNAENIIGKISVTGNIAPDEPVDESAVFETNKSLVQRVKRLESQLKTAKAQRDELADLITPGVDWKLMVDIDNLTVGRMCTAGWKPIFMSTSPRPGVMGATKGISPVVVTVIFERVSPDRPTPPERALVKHDNELSTSQDDDPQEEDAADQAAARLIERVVPLPSMRVLPTYDKNVLNGIVKRNAYRRVNAVLSGGDAS